MEPFPEIRINTSSSTARKASAIRQSSGSLDLTARLLVIVLASAAALLLFGGILPKAGSKGKAKKRQSAMAGLQKSATESGRNKSKRDRKPSPPEASELEKDSYAQGWERGVHDGTYWARNLERAVEAGNDAVAAACLESIANVVNSSHSIWEQNARNVMLYEQHTGKTCEETGRSDYIASRAHCLGHYEGLMSVVGKYVQ